MREGKRIQANYLKKYFTRFSLEIAVLQEGIIMPSHLECCSCRKCRLLKYIIIEATKNSVKIINQNLENDISVLIVKTPDARRSKRLQNKKFNKI